MTDRVPHTTIESRFAASLRGAPVVAGPCASWTGWGDGPSAARFDEAFPRPVSSTTGALRTWVL